MPFLKSGARSAISSYDVAAELRIDHKTVLAHLKKAGYTKKLDIWVPHELTERNLMNRVLICDSLLRHNETEPFLKKLITDDEKWITYDNNVRKRSWSKAGQASQTVAKPGLTRNKVMLCVWWDWKSIIHYELLPFVHFMLMCGKRLPLPFKYYEYIYQVSKYHAESYIRTFVGPSL
ncbi:hypothetical protein K1T71_009304 [Dendrolimus kikuchii]|uniref:Uncharacterized protein n=1 Tax=Dendrolimus kikuchii TaxID=765133 RepID=A0ACC1CU20_9NEOP|nr:hypothetical protein K1T71_009304 [Dendrolimus kikuchii]